MERVVSPVQSNGWKRSGQYFLFYRLNPHVEMAGESIDLARNRPDLHTSQMNVLKLLMRRITRSLGEKIEMLRSRGDPSFCYTRWSSRNLAPDIAARKRALPIRRRAPASVIFSIFVWSVNFSILQKRDRGEEVGAYPSSVRLNEQNQKIYIGYLRPLL